MSWGEGLTWSVKADGFVDPVVQDIQVVSKQDKFGRQNRQVNLKRDLKEKQAQIDEEDERALESESLRNSRLEHMRTEGFDLTKRMYVSEYV
jgi:hypothetical protein